MPDPLTPDDLDAILRGGGSAEEKLQRAAAMALEKRAMDKDLLTEAELWALASPDVGSFRAKLQAAARLGAERERERAARVCEKRAETRMQDNGVYDDDTGAWEYPSYAEWCLTADEEDDDCAAAIRRGEGG